MQATPRGMRIHIGLFGRRNAGKSSLLNGLAGQAVAIVSEVPGTTTDPVEKAMELQPIGPVVLIDTPGLDDEGSLGDRRVGAALKAAGRAELGLVVVGDGCFGPFEERAVSALRRQQSAVVVVFSQSDRVLPGPEATGAADRLGLSWVVVSATTGRGLDRLREEIVRAVAPEALARPTILSDLLPPGGLAVLVVPIDMEAPKGRLILPQVQAIRDLLDGGRGCLVVRERELAGYLPRLSAPPDLVVTDSQAFLKAAADTPPGVPLTSFSILFARLKGDLPELARGAAAIDSLRPGDRVLVAEACSHHPNGDDIGRVKLPRWLEQFVGGRLEFTTVAGRDFPDDLSPFSLVVHCGACVATRREVIARIGASKAAGVPVTNYGLAIARTLGILERALEPFPAALAAYREAAGGRERGG